MAEFQEVMRQWRRMCDAYITDDAVSCCKGCPMSGRGCGPIYENGNAEPNIIEREVMTWAAENPEPVYLTWAEYLVSIGVLPEETSKDMLIKDVSKGMMKRIPADVAIKLGLKPVNPSPTCGPDYCEIE